MSTKTTLFCSAKEKITLRSYSMLKLHKSLSFPDSLCVLSFGSKGLFLKSSTRSQNLVSKPALPATLFLNALLKDELKAISIIQHSFERIRITREYQLAFLQFVQTGLIIIKHLLPSFFGKVFFDEGLQLNLFLGGQVLHLFHDFRETIFHGL